MKLFNCQLIILLSVTLGACSNYSKVSPYKPQRQGTTEYEANFECTEYVEIATGYYDKKNTLQGVDVSNFESAINALESAIIKCRDLEYEDDLLFSLANAYFYTGQYYDSQLRYQLISTRFQSSSFNIGKHTAYDEYQLLKHCSNDQFMENYRRAELFEIHGEYDNSRKEYRYVISSSCRLLRLRATKKINRLKYIE